MYMDKLLTYSDGQAFTDTANSTNIITHSVAAHDLAAGEPLYFVVNCTIVGAGFTNFVITLTTDTAVGMGTEAIIYTSPTIVVASVVAGATLISAPIPSGAWKTYSRATVTFSDNGTCSLDMFLTLNPDSTKKLYADGITIS